jgi:hypothetical protein
MKRPALFSLVVFALSFAACDFLPDSEYGDEFDLLAPVLNEPVVTAGNVALVQSPGVQTLSAYYCPLLLDDPFVEIACAGLVGPVPPMTELIFRFELPLYVENTNDFPLPAVELLTALNLFPGEDRRQLAAICVSFCEVGDLECLDKAPGTCSSNEPEINTLEDLASAALDYLSVYVASRLSGEVPPELRVRLIEPHKKALVLVTFDLHPDPLLEALEIAFADHLDEILGQEDVTIAIPYDIEGAIWFVVENFGRFGVNFGPIEGLWEL